MQWSHTAYHPKKGSVRLFARWGDMCAYYEANDGTAVSYNNCTFNWSNEGDAETCKENIRNGRLRGELVN